MEGITLSVIVEIFKAFGFAGLVTIIWWIDAKNIRKVLDCYREDTQAAVRRYEDNVRLVTHYEALAKDLKDVVMMNTQAMTQNYQAIKTNQYCPQVRLEKKSIGEQV